MSKAQTAERRARLLVRCYPPAWRARYGDEFVQLLVDEISERPRSLSRTADVVRSGLIARLESAGLAGDTLDPQRQVRAGLAALSLAVSAFLAAGVAIWAQLTIGWQWSAPAAPATKTGMLVMSGAMLGFALLAVLGAVPLVWTICREMAAGRGRRAIASARTIRFTPRRRAAGAMPKSAVVEITAAATTTRSSQANTLALAATAGGRRPAGLHARRRELHFGHGWPWVTGGPPGAERHRAGRGDGLSSTSLRRADHAVDHVLSGASPDLDLHRHEARRRDRDRSRVGERDARRLGSLALLDRPARADLAGYQLRRPPLSSHRAAYPMPRRGSPRRAFPSRRR